ncbi:CRISPR-associated endonuclease Cas2 [Candidatus Desantisbacteria bacterium]|nr:CRISPR-associated endonuclease Cas2 [Candidatus Desantisbacteria bacterium]
MFLIVAYDVTDDKRRAKIAVQLHNFGQRVQKSVFECYLNKEQLDELKIRLEKIMDFAEDSIRYYYLCKKDEKNIEFIGENIIYKNEDYFMI